MSAPNFVIVPPVGRTVREPTMGVFLDRSPSEIPDRAMQDCRNVRIKEGQIQAENMGWETYPIGETQINLDDRRVMLITQLFLSNGAQHQIFANTTDLFRYDEGSSTVKYITPRYIVGQVGNVIYIPPATDASLVAGVGTLWNTVDPTRNGLNNVEPGDYIHVGVANEEDQVPTGGSLTWNRVASITSDVLLTTEGDAGAGLGFPIDYTIRQTLSGDELNVFRDDTFPSFDTGGGIEDRIYITNGVDLVHQWAGTTDAPNGATRVHGLGFTCKDLRYYKNMMGYANLVEGAVFKPKALRNSDIGDPEDVTNGFASEFAPGGGTDQIKSLARLGDSLVVYHERSIDVLDFVADPFIFVSRTAVTGFGPVTINSVADFGDYHEFLGDDRMYVFNGVGIEEVHGHVMREVLRTISPQRREMLLTHFDEENGELQWVVPLTNDGTGTTGGPTTAYTEHYTDPFNFSDGPRVPFTIRDLPATAMGYFERASTLTWDQITTQWKDTNYRWNDRFFEAAFPFNLFGDENGDIFVLGGSDAQNSSTTAVAINSRFRTGRKMTSDGESVGLVKRVYPFAKKRGSATAALSVSVYGTDREYGDVTLLDAQTYDLTHAGERFVPFRVASRFHELEFGTNSNSGPWQLDGWRIVTKRMGDR